MAITCKKLDGWLQFVEFARQKCSPTAFENWIAPIICAELSESDCLLKVPNVFVQEYLLENFKDDLRAFLPVKPDGCLAVRFSVGEQRPQLQVQRVEKKQVAAAIDSSLNTHYTFENFIEGPSNQFVKSASLGVANRPGRSYNPLFIHGPVGLGKTHLLHAVGHFAHHQHRKLRVKCITTEGFINELVDSLKAKMVDKMKRFYRSLDILLVDDIQFLQNRLNFEEEFCNTFETLINQGKQIVITSDKSPAQLRLSERIVARMEWGLVAQVGMPDLETRVAILQHKSQLRGLALTQDIAFYIAEKVCSNVRQLEGVVNKLSAQSRLLNARIDEPLVQKSLGDWFKPVSKPKVSVEQILKAVAAIFEVRVSDLKGTARNKEIALPRQVAMFLAKEMVDESLIMLGATFGKTHSTILHACKIVEKKILSDGQLLQKIEIVRRQMDQL